MHTKYYSVAGITIQLDSELPIEEKTFAPKFKLFETDGPGHDNIHLVHHFFLPDHTEIKGRQVYKKPPWRIHADANGYTYILETSPDPAVTQTRQLSLVSSDHTYLQIYNSNFIQQAYQHGNMGALTFAPTDQILLAQLLADRSGCYIHSDGVNLDGKGLLFVGHSGAGKSTIATQLQARAEILCDDRMIVRKWQDGYHIHGNWSHGSLPIVSSNSAPLYGIFFLEQAAENRILPMDKRMDAISRLLGCMIKPMVSRDWWEKMLNLMEDMAQNVPCYRLKFDKSGDIYRVLQEL